MVKGHSNDALIIGRFQPLHKGHLEVIKKVASECDRMGREERDQSSGEACC